MDKSKRKKSICYISIFSFFVSVLAFVCLLLENDSRKLGIGFILWGSLPLLVAVIIRTITRDWSDAGFKPAIRINLRWYIICALIFPIMQIFTLIIGSKIAATLITGFSFGEYLKLFFLGFWIFFIFAIFEEVGWRGYLVPKLASIGINLYLAYFILMAVWTIWHLPFIRQLTWLYPSGDFLTFIPRFCLQMFAFSILYTEIRLITKSIWPGILLHGMSNAFGHLLVAKYVKFTPGMEYLVSFSGFILIAFILFFGITLKIWRKRKNLQLI